MNKNWFTRFEQPELDDTYFHNMMNATAYFRKWFMHAGDVTYKVMLQKMHEIVADGYQGYTNSNYILKVPNGFRGDRRTTWYPILKKKWFDIDSKIGDTIRPVVKGVPKAMTHYLDNTDEGYVLHLPDGKYVRCYLHMLRSVMCGLKQGVSLSMLATYIQLFVIGHPFEKINYSICMAQVNAILYLKGYSTVFHGWLDFECFVYDYERIEKSFIKMVRGQ